MKNDVFYKNQRKRIRLIGRSGNISFIIKYLYRKLFYRSYLRTYKNHILKNKPTKVIYSCITSGYDKPKKLHNLNMEYNYIMFTDRPEDYDSKDYPWNFIKLNAPGLNGSKDSRYPKLNPHKVLPEYQESVWIDANIDILNDTLYNDIQQARNANASIAIGVHPKRNCIYQEFERCINGKVDDPEVIEKQLKKVRSSGYPSKNGLFENNIIYRKHHDSSVIKFNKDCWTMIQEGSKRDQLSLVYCAWKNDLKILPLNAKSYRRMPKNIIIFPHK